MNQLRVAISATRQQHRVVVGHIESENFALVWLGLMNILLANQVILEQLSVGGGDDNSLVLGAPHCFGEDDVLAGLNLVLHFWCVAGEAFLHIKDSDVGAFLELVQTHDHLVAKAEGDHLRVDAGHLH